MHNHTMQYHQRRQLKGQKRHNNEKKKDNATMRTEQSKCRQASSTEQKTTDCGMRAIQRSSERGRERKGRKTERDI